MANANAYRCTYEGYDQESGKFHARVSLYPDMKAHIIYDFDTEKEAQAWIASRQFPQQTMKRWEKIFLWIVIPPTAAFLFWFLFVWNVPPIGPQASP